MLQVTLSLKHKKNSKNFTSSVALLGIKASFWNIVASEPVFKPGFNER
jgi:hypothetical protein